MTHSLYFRLNEAARTVEVDRLHIGSAVTDLRTEDICTIGDLARRIELEPRGLRGIHGLSRNVVAHIQRRLDVLSSAVDEEGEIDWIRFDNDCSRMSNVGLLRAGELHDVQPVYATRVQLHLPEIKLVPSRELATGDEFLDAIPEVFEAIVQSRGSHVDQLLLVERISKEPQERKTLEQIAAAASGSLTRERVRQREQKLIDLLAAALIHGRQRRLGVYFHPSFTKFWRLAADWFGQKEMISFWEFIEGLSAAWNVSGERVLQNLPLVLAILTRKATVPKGIRSQMKLAPKTFTKLNEAECELPIGTLALGKAGLSLTEEGIQTIGDFLDMIRQGKAPSAGSAAGQAIQRTLIALAEAMTSTGGVDWIRYGEAMGFRRLPAKAPQTAAEFLDNMVSDLDDIIKANDISLRANIIFRLRIAVPRTSRPTLAQVAEQLHTHGPSVKREESILLRSLNDFLVERDFTQSQVVYSLVFLHYWEVAAEVFKSSANDFGTFCRGLAEEWNLPIQRTEESAEVLWAVLSEYPRGRPRRVKSRGSSEAQRRITQSESGVILLRGFRTVH